MVACVPALVNTMGRRGNEPEDVPSDFCAGTSVVANLCKRAGDLKTALVRPLLDRTDVLSNKSVFNALYNRFLENGPVFLFPIVTCQFAHARSAGQALLQQTSCVFGNFSRTRVRFVRAPRSPTKSIAW